MFYDGYNVCSGNVLRVNQIKFKWKVRKSRLPFQSIYFIFFSPGKDGLKLSHCLQSHQFHLVPDQVFPSPRCAGVR